MSEYQMLIEKITAPDGVLCKVGGRYQQEQVEYIRSTANFIEHSGGQGLDVAAIEAETGIGKSLGYLIPATVWLACHPDSKPIAVSTHTRALQTQIYYQDMTLIEKVFHELALPMPTYAYRMGKQAFFSLSRVANIVDILSKNGRDDEAYVKQLNQFERKVQDICQTGSGLWQEYLDEYETFPHGISSEDVWLVDRGQVDNEGYVRHLSLAENARLLVTNHASLLSKWVFNAVSFHTVIIDESHEMPAVCESMSNRRLQVQQMISSLVATGLKNKTIETAIELSSQLDQELRAIDQQFFGRNMVLTDTQHATILNKIAVKAHEILDKYKKVITQYTKKINVDAMTQDEAHILNKLEEAVESLQQFGEQGNSHRQRAIMYSKINRIPSLASISNYPGSLFHYRIKDLTTQVFLTSATIADINQKNTTFVNFLNRVGLSDYSPALSLKLSPRNYGQMVFVKTSKSVPNPLSAYHESSEFNPKWVDNCCEMIMAAYAAGKTLVLTQSFDETLLLGIKLSEHRDILVHKPTMKLSEVLSLFLSGKYQILITPSAWHGVSLRDRESGGQFITNLVITRVPFKPASEEVKQLTIDRLLAKNKTSQQAQTILFVRQQQEAVDKLKQGIGRGCRAPTDSIKVWFCDPRMTMIKSYEKTGLIHAIPKRFLQSFFEGQIFGEETRQPIDTAVYL